MNSQRLIPQNQKRTGVFLCLLLAVLLLAITASAAFSWETTAELPLRKALEDPEILAYLTEHDKISEIHQAQEPLRTQQHEKTAAEINKSQEKSAAAADTVKDIHERYGLMLPGALPYGLIDSGTLSVTRNRQGRILDVRYRLDD